MPLDYATLARLRSHDPAWKLLYDEHAPLIVSFCARVFIEPNVRVISQAALVEALEDELYALREQLGTSAFPKPAQAYLNHWAEPEKGWLRKFYPPDSDDPSFDLTPATEKALRWLDSLSERTFVGTESRLLTLFDLLRQMAEGTETDPALRIAELERKRSENSADPNPSTSPVAVVCEANYENGLVNVTDPNVNAGRDHRLSVNTN